MQITKLMTAIASICLASTTLAIEYVAPSIYVSVDGGYGFTNFLSNSPEASSSTYNNWAPVWGGSVGFLVTPNFGAEVGYLYGGTNTMTVKTSGASQTFNLISNSYFLTAALKGLFYDRDENLGFFVKAGVAQGNITYQNNTATLPSSNYNLTGYQSYTPYFALGVFQNINKYWAISLVAHAMPSLNANTVPADSTDTPARLPDFYAGTLEITFAI